MMISILWKICPLLPLVLINTGVECRDCEIESLDRIDGICTGQITCKRDLDFDVRTWYCIKHYNGYSTSGRSYPSYYRSRYYDDDYGSPYRPYRSRSSYTYDDKYNLIVYIKEPREGYSFIQHERHTIKLILDGGDYLTMPVQVLQMGHLKEFTIFGNDFASVKLSQFDSIATLEKLNITNNKIRVIETDENSETINNGSKAIFKP